MRTFAGKFICNIMKRIVRSILAYTLLATATNTLVAQNQAPLRASRQSTLLNAKNMVLTTTKGTNYYYFVTTDERQMMHLGDGTVRIGQDEFQRSDIKGIRFRSLQRSIMHEDSTTFDKSLALDHSLLALRRTMNQGKWNSLVLPFDLTGLQILDVFGEETEVASPRGIGEDSETVVEFTTLDLQTDEVVIRANNHYLVRPSREPDVEEGKRLTGFGSTQLYGPIYLIPNVTMKASQSPRIQTIENDDASKKVRFRGTYLKLDDSVVSGRTIKNKRVAPGMYMINDEGFIGQLQDSTIVGAFRSWIEDLNEEGKPLHFYVDGVNEDITANSTGIEELLANKPLTNAVYDLSGRRISDSSLGSRLSALKRGIYIVNGKKVAIK